MPSDAMALLYDLTPAETRIFELLTTGMTQAAIGDALGIAASTVKTHVLHLFEKTGCQRQVDLMKPATTLSSPV
jgi:DNA-binding CsgD family transcriptional regulator